MGPSVWRSLSYFFSSSSAVKTAGDMSVR